VDAETTAAGCCTAEACCWSSIASFCSKLCDSSAGNIAGCSNGNTTAGSGGSVIGSCNVTGSPGVAWIAMGGPDDVT